MVFLQRFQKHFTLRIVGFSLKATNVVLFIYLFIEEKANRILKKIERQKQINIFIWTVVVNTSMPKHLKQIPAISHFSCWAEAFLLFLKIFPCLFEQKAFAFFLYFNGSKRIIYKLAILYRLMLCFILKETALRY